VDYTIVRINANNLHKNIEEIQELFWEYLEWANGRLNKEYSINLDIKSILEQDMEKLEVFLYSYSRLLLAKEDDFPVGIVCIRKILADVGEIKRMYVRPKFRGQGIGKSLLDSAIVESRDIGYSKIRLDSTKFMNTAHALYKSTGFYEIDPYIGSEIPPRFHQYWIFMEKQL
jgi:ribosomal protein S18 acetylase RimI-like enzyme|tara:strand:- start:34 stop:549 length:516 start_codon:yes stop_codon:yes gene_type:complete